MGMNIKDKTERVSTAGHGCADTIDAKKMGDQITKKIRENILSGRWYPSSQPEIQMLREYRAEQELKKC